MHRLSSVVVATAAACVLAGPAEGQLGSRGGAVADLWANNCTHCHGESGAGANAQSLLDDEYLTDGSDRALFDATKDGLPDSGMPGYGETLSDPQIWGLVVHLRELQAKARRARTGSPQEVDGVYASTHEKFRVEPVIESGVQVPWSVDFLPGSDPAKPKLLVTERPGRLRIWDNGTLGEPVSGTPAVRARGQGGLMEVAVHPAYQENGWVYLSYSDPRPYEGRPPTVGMTKVVRGKIADGEWTSQQTIFESKPEHYLPTDIHFGCKIQFSPRAEDRHIYFTIGERGAGDHAQDLTRPNGKIHRLMDDGTVPDDNPFAGRKDAYPSIWSYGHRNPQGLVFDLNGDLWDTEHGPRGGDELNLIKKGANYGWPEVSFGINYNDAPYRTPWPEEGQAFVMPVDRWLPSVGASGLDVVRGDAFPAWRGDLLAGGLSGENVERFRIRDGKVVEREEILHGLGRVRDIATGPDGSVYVVLNGPDRVVRLVPADAGGADTPQPRTE